MTNLTAAFMAIGLSTSTQFSAAHEHCDIGHVDMVDSLLRYADFVDALGHVGHAATGDYPGVFLYEVAEEVGELYNLALLGEEPGHCPDHEAFLAVIRTRVYDFFAQGVDDAALLAHLAAAVKAVAFEEPK